jgi:hypothetical protein
LAANKSTAVFGEPADLAVGLAALAALSANRKQSAMVKGRNRIKVMTDCLQIAPAIAGCRQMDSYIKVR